MWLLKIKQMQDLGTKLNPITKVRLFQEIKKIVFTRLDKNSISPERSNKILAYLKKHIVAINTPKEAKKFYMNIGTDFSELLPIKTKFEIEEKEKMHRVLVVILDAVLEKYDFEFATRIMEEVEAIEEKKGRTIEDLAREIPEEFNAAVAQVQNEK